MGYVRDNLAVHSQKQRAKQPQFGHTNKKVTRKFTLPTREKLLYLGTILFCSALALFIMSGYTDIYHLNLQVQTTKRDTTALQQKVSKLMIQQELLSDWKQIEQIAKQHGLKFTGSLTEINIYKSQGNDVKRNEDG